MLLHEFHKASHVLLLVPCEARVEIILEALEDGRVLIQGCLEAKLQGCAAFELRRRSTLLCRLPQREGAQRRELHRKLRLKLVTEAMQDGRRFLAVAIEVHVLRLRVINEVRLVLHNETLERRRMLHLLVPREARVEIAPEALEVGRVPFQGCLKAKLPGCAASELRRRRTRLRRLPQREGAQRVWPHLPLSSQRSLADIYWIEACSAAEHEMAADSKQGVALAAGIPVHGGNEANAEAVQSRQPELHLPSP